MVTGNIVLLMVWFPGKVHFGALIIHAVALFALRYLTSAPNLCTMMSSLGDTLPGCSVLAPQGDRQERRPV